MPLLALVRLALQRIFSQLGLMMCLLMGIAVTVALASAIPTFSDAVQLRLLRQKIEMWRARYQPVAERIAELEKEIPQLEADMARAGSVPYEDDNPFKNRQTKRDSDMARGRLAEARKELEETRRELREIEEAARRDGVSSGQLY